jgi:hypothetical protein
VRRTADDRGSNKRKGSDVAQNERHNGGAGDTTPTWTAATGGAARMSRGARMAVVCRLACRDVAFRMALVLTISSATFVVFATVRLARLSTAVVGHDWCLSALWTVAFHLMFVAIHDFTLQFVRMYQTLLGFYAVAPTRAPLHLRRCFRVSYALDLLLALVPLAINVEPRLHAQLTAAFLAGLALETLVVACAFCFVGVRVVRLLQLHFRETAPTTMRHTILRLKWIIYMVCNDAFVGVPALCYCAYSAPLRDGIAYYLIPHTTLVVLVLVPPPPSVFSRPPLFLFVCCCCCRIGRRRRRRDHRSLCCSCWRCTRCATRYSRRSAKAASPTKRWWWRRPGPPSTPLPRHEVRARARAHAHTHAYLSRRRTFLCGAGGERVRVRSLELCDSKRTYTTPQFRGTE